METPNEKQDETAEKTPVRGPRLERYGAIKKGIYIVPSLITSAALFSGFYAIIASINDQFYMAAWAILLAIFLDGMDGRVARLTGATSHFGVEYDSLSDLVAFGVAPAIMMYNWVLQPFGKIGWMAAFLMVICAALRLARFNTQTVEVAKNRFVGLPVPAAAGLLATIILLTRGSQELDGVTAILVVITVYSVALLMVSNIPYTSFKHIKLGQKRPFHKTLWVILIALMIAMFPHTILFLLGVVYVGQGPLEWLWNSRNLTLQQKMWSLLGISEPTQDQ